MRTTSDSSLVLTASIVTASSLLLEAFDLRFLAIFQDYIKVSCVVVRV